MSKPLKALLLSALIYPGAGHFFIRSYKTCLALVTLFSISLFFVITDIVNQANIIIERIIKGEIPLNQETINESILALSSTEQQNANIHLYLMLIIWIAAIVDVYRIARKNN
ncbi:hypothetical protein [Psychromonas sp. MME2]|uniref:hypothetical protein n=1 Tax=unclassified Psychromonas TaxID=2614957 RepID=UPI00339CB6DA